MQVRRQYNGLDAAKFFLAILVAMRHIIQIFFTADSRWHLLIGSWLSNLAVPTFFIISAFFLFRKVDKEKPDGKVIIGYCKKVLRMYLIWSAIYLPIDWYNWYHGESGVWEGIRAYVQSFLFSSSIVQLWYLPALAVACLIVWFLYTRGMRIWQILVVTGCLFIVGVVGDNWYLNEMLPHRVYLVLMAYIRYFLTMRNGLFYGAFYAAIGLLFAKTEWRLPQWAAVAGTVFFVYAMYREVLWSKNTNMLFMAAPAVYCLFTAVSAVKWKNRELYPRLRAMSEWIYLSHFYFFYFFSWTTKWNPVPLNNVSVMAMVLGAVVLFAWGMVLLAERERFRWLRKLI